MGMRQNKHNHQEIILQIQLQEKQAMEITIL